MPPNLSITAALALLVPETVFAQNVVVIDTTVRMSMTDVLNGLVNIMLFWALPASTLLFLIGAFLLVISAGNDNSKDRAKKIMQGSLIGLGIILGSWMIVSTVLYLVAA